MADQKLNIVISALDKTKTAFGGITKSIGVVTSAVFSLRAAIVSVVGVGGIGLLITRSIQATDSLAKTSAKLGVTTEELSGLRYAAELAGVGVQTTDMAVQRFTRRLAEAANGTGEAKDALRELNINAKSLQQLSLSEQMAALADAFGGVENSSDKVRLAFKLFDSEGVAFVNLLNEGSASIKELVAEAGGLGVVMSAQAAAGVEKASDAFFRLQSLLGGIIDQIVAALAPALTALADGFSKYLKGAIEEANGSIENFGKVAAQYIVNSIADILGVLRESLLGFQNFINGLEDIAKKSEFLSRVFNTFTTDLGLFIGGVGEAERKIRELGKTIGDPQAPDSLAGSLDNAKPKLTALEELMLKISKAFKEASKPTQDLQQTLTDAAKKGVDSMTDALFDVVTGANSAKDAFKNMAKSILADLAKMAIRQSIVQPLFSTLSSAFAPAPAGKAIGGSVSRGSAYMVGERGPELFVPNRSGSIVPNDQMSSGGGMTNVTLNISTGVSQTVRAEIANLMPQITEATKAGVLEARQRGGSYSRALAGI